jgi:hypothetical protein
MAKPDCGKKDGRRNQVAHRDSHRHSTVEGPADNGVRAQGPYQLLSLHAIFSMLPRPRSFAAPACFFAARRIEFCRVSTASLTSPALSFRAAPTEPFVASEWIVTFRIEKRAGLAQ